MSGAIGPRSQPDPSPVDDATKREVIEDVHEAAGAVADFGHDLGKALAYENALNVDVGSGGAALRYERSLSPHNLTDPSTSLGFEVGRDDGQMKYGVSLNEYSPEPHMLPLAFILSTEGMASLRYTHGADGDRLGGRAGVNSRLGFGALNMGAYLGVDRAIAGGGEKKWGFEGGVTLGMNF